MIHLHAVEDRGPAMPSVKSATRIPEVFFVIQRQNGHWSPAAKIMAVHDTELAAEQDAAHFKELYPHQFFGVAALRSEARPVPKPIEIVRAR